MQQNGPTAIQANHHNHAHYSDPYRLRTFSVSPSESITFPTRFIQPPIPPIDPLAIHALCPEFAPLSVPEIHQRFQSEKMKYMSAKKRVKIDSFIGPETIRISWRDPVAVHPTHVLSISPPLPSGGSSTASSSSSSPPSSPALKFNLHTSPTPPGTPHSPDNSLFVCHAVVLLSHCSNLSHTLPPSPAIPLHHHGRISVGVPIVQLHLHLQPFEYLLQYLYDGDPTKLLKSLVPFPSINNASVAYDPETRFRVVGDLARVFAMDKFAPDGNMMRALLKHVRILEDFRENAVVLGVSDENVWDVMRIAWALLCILIDGIQVAKGENPLFNYHD
jgi:hypothetical protein